MVRWVEGSYVVNLSCFLVLSRVNLSTWAWVLVTSSITNLEQKI